MATSEHWQIPWVVDVIAREQPKTILDVGGGQGKFGALAREFANPERVDSLDVSAPRVDSYDHFYEGDLREMDSLLPADAPIYDLALFIETIEHLEKEEAWAFLERLTKRARKVAIATPWGFRHQEIPGMPFETHRSGWYPWEFKKRYRVHHWSVYPGHLTRRLRLPRLWQFIVVISRRDT